MQITINDASLNISNMSKETNNAINKISDVTSILNDEGLNIIAKLVEKCTTATTEELVATMSEFNSSAEKLQVEVNKFK